MRGPLRAHRRSRHFVQIRADNRSRNTRTCRFSTELSSRILAASAIPPDDVTIAAGPNRCELLAAADSRWPTRRTSACGIARAIQVQVDESR